MYPQFIILSKNAKDITGQRFGRLIALGPTGKTPSDKIKWLCRCDCGETCEIISNQLLFGKTRSCGCLRKETTAKQSTIHGMSNHPLHGIWRGMISRCTNSSEKAYADYGGRGISIAPEWRYNFKPFYDYVSQLSHCGEKGYSLDRIDNDGNYEPGNLRWATRIEQSHNSRRVIFLTYDGKTQILSQWAKDLGINTSTLQYRLRKWSIERALTVPRRSWQKSP